MLSGWLNMGNWYIIMEINDLGMSFIFVFHQALQDVMNSNVILNQGVPKIWLLDWITVINP